jgi:uncharacterized OsmC-like protein
VADVQECGHGPAQRETAERVLGFDADVCPVSRTLRGCIAISTALNWFRSIP